MKISMRTSIWYCFIGTYIEQNSRRDMHTDQATSLDKQLKIISHLVT